MPQRIKPNDTRQPTQSRTWHSLFLEVLKMACADDKCADVLMKNHLGKSKNLMGEGLASTFPPPSLYV